MVFVIADMGKHSARKEISIAVHPGKITLLLNNFFSPNNCFKGEYGARWILISLFRFRWPLPCIWRFFVIIFNFSTSISVSVLISSLGWNNFWAKIPFFREIEIHPKKFSKCNCKHDKSYLKRKEGQKLTWRHFGLWANCLGWNNYWAKG